MTDEDLHLLGIKAVYKNLIDKGWEVLNVRREPGINPQILAREKGEMVMIVVKTARYPRMGVLTPEIAAQVAMHAEKHKVKPMFASVGVANANGETEEEMALPLKDGEYFINFNGLLEFPK